MATEYVTKWVEAEALPRATEESVIQFLLHLFVRYGLPREIITDGGPQFAGNRIAATLNNYHVQHKITTPYHPQANGQVESTNKVIEAILTKTIASHRCNWATRFPEALWAYRTTWRNTTGFTPYESVYGKQFTLPIEVEIKTLQITFELGMDLSQAQHNCLQRLNELGELRLVSIEHTTIVKQKRGKWHDYSDYIQIFTVSLHSLIGIFTIKVIISLQFHNLGFIKSPPFVCKFTIFM